MNVNEFVNKYKISQNKEDIIKKIIKNTYVPYLEKCVWCTKTIQASTKIVDTDIVKIDSATQYIGFVMRLMDLYTDLDIKFENAEFVNQYDALAKLGAVVPIISAIPQSEYAEFKMILDMKNSDFRENEYSITALLYNFKKSLNITEETINNAFEKIIKDYQAENK